MCAIYGRIEPQGLGPCGGGQSHQAVILLPTVVQQFFERLVAVKTSFEDVVRALLVAHFQEDALVHHIGKIEA